jgi:serine/threonine protein kinase
MNETEKVKCLRQIGKGSFSNVYLFENQEFSESLLNSIGYDSLFFSSNVSKSSNIANQYFIIKEIDLSKLVYKYLSKKQKSRKVQNIPKKEKNYGTVWNTASVNITPYGFNHPINVKADITEEDYYHSKLQELIEGEILILKCFNHPNLIHYYSSSFSQDVYSIKMEFCNLGDLYSILKEKNHFKEITRGELKMVSENDKYNLKKFRNQFKGFNNKFIKKYLIDTVHGLKYMHDRNIIHRDIKLHNFLVNKNENDDLDFKISDFGFSCYDMSETEPESERKEALLSSFMNISSDSIKKKYNKLCGTPYYMAPEILTNMEKFEQLLPSNEFSDEIPQSKTTQYLYNKKIDLWSYGICLYELLFNILPFSNMSDINDLKNFYSNRLTQTLIFKNIKEKSTISDEMKYILRKLLTINPKERITTDELLDLIQMLPDVDINTQCENSSISTANSINMGSWSIEDIDLVESKHWDKIDASSDFKNLTLSVDNNFIKWLGLKDTKPN